MTYCIFCNSNSECSKCAPTPHPFLRANKTGCVADCYDNDLGI